MLDILIAGIAAVICFIMVGYFASSIKRDVTKIQQAEEKLKGQIKIFNRDRHGIETPDMPPYDFRRLTQSFWSLLTGKEISPISGILNLTAFVDPMLSLYLKERTTGATMTPALATKTIEELYHRYPPNVRGLFEVNAEELQKHEEGKRIGEAILSFLNSISVKCSSCGELIPEKIAECLYCNTRQELRKEVEVDPLKVLKLRYAKGEITKEQYEEMKKTLMAS